ncbi:ribonuclease H-like domain-containing protein [Tanacetum coccineum]
MQNCNPCRTPDDTESKLGSDGDPTLYRSLAGADQIYLMLCSRVLLFMAFSFMCLSLFSLLHILTLIGIVALLLAGLPQRQYRGVANVVAETAWLQNLFLELHASLSTATIVYCDNVSAVYLSTNPVQHQRTKHIEIDIYFV